jgi:hypothetical protein
VPSWSISRNYKENWNSTKIRVTPGMHLARGDNVQRPLTCGPRAWPANQIPWPAGPTLQPLWVGFTGYTCKEAITRNPKPEVSGSRTRLPPGDVARPAGQHLPCYQLNQVDNSSLDPYKYPPTDAIQDTTLYF